MNESERILQEAREEANRIICEAREEAKKIEDSAKEKKLSYQEYIRKLGRRGLKFNHECDDWIDCFDDDTLNKAKQSLKENAKKQKRMFKCGSLSVVEWEVSSWGDYNRCNNCQNGVSVLTQRMSMADMGIGYMESALKNAQRCLLEWGLQKSLDYLTELKVNTEAQMRSAFQYPHITEEYMSLKVEEIKLRYTIAFRKQQLKERARHEKELAREEAKAQKEFERELRKAKADEDSARKALEKAQLEAAKEAANEKRFAKLQEQIEELQAALKEAEERGQRIMSMAQQTRRGWVYVISNIGSFGEGVYKIGLTRRLDPMERVYELGDASVPFPFDVHAFIFSEDAPALETALHQAFDHCKLNSVNYRKEYFRVPLEKIKSKVKELGYDVEFEDYPYAPQFRDSVLRK